MRASEGQASADKPSAPIFQDTATYDFFCEIAEVVQHWASAEPKKGYNTGRRSPQSQVKLKLKQSSRENPHVWLRAAVTPTKAARAKLTATLGVFRCSHSHTRPSVSRTYCRELRGHVPFHGIRGFRVHRGIGRDNLTGAYTCHVRNTPAGQLLSRLNQCKMLD